MCGQHSRALKFYLQCGDREIDAAIEVVAKSQNENLSLQLVDFLMGEKDGIPKDLNYMYKLWMAKKRYEEAVKAALSIARQEQDLGNYGVSHSVIFETIRRLEDEEVRVPLKLRTAFVLLHSYMLAKILVKMGDSNGAARMLLRVAQSISSFPVDVVKILTSTVVMCQKANLKASSYEYAKTLMHPEHRASINENFKRKIEAIVRRKSSNNDDAIEDLSPCPISGQLIPLTQLESPVTRDALPMCVITGRHMVLDDWCFCPNTKFPVLYSEYIHYIDVMNSTPTEDGQSGTAVDPILGLPVYIADLKKVSSEEALAYIQKYNNVKDESKEKTAASTGPKLDSNGSNNTSSLDVAV
jgi:WD repeat-containing protein 19